MGLGLEAAVKSHSEAGQPPSSRARHPEPGNHSDPPPGTPPATSHRYGEHLLQEFDMDLELKQFIEGLNKFKVEAKSEIAGIRQDLDGLALDGARAGIGATSGPDLASTIWDDGEFKSLRDHGRGKCLIQVPTSALETKATITSSAVGSATSGVLQIDRAPGVIPLARKRLFIRDLLTVRPTTKTAIDYVKISSAPMSPAMQTEASAKSESALNFTTVTANVRTLAHWIPASRQVIEDLDVLRATIDSELIYALRDVEEVQILSGSGTGLNLNGLITQATSFSTGLLGSAYTKIDQLRRVIQQLQTANEEPNFIILNPVDLADIELTKIPMQANYGGAYIIGSPMAIAPNVRRLWGVPMMTTNNISSGTFLVGSSRLATIWERSAVTIEISTEHSDFFTKNLVAIRCEERLALAVTRPSGFITGSFTTSP